jgi:hypothetical protein
MSGWLREERVLRDACGEDMLPRTCRAHLKRTLCKRPKIGVVISNIHLRGGKDESANCSGYASRPKSCTYTCTCTCTAVRLYGCTCTCTVPVPVPAPNLYLYMYRYLYLYTPFVLDQSFHWECRVWMSQITCSRDIMTPGNMAEQR